jgi:hypothetical protein
MVPTEMLSLSATSVMVSRRTARFMVGSLSVIVGGLLPGEAGDSRSSIVDCLVMVAGIVSRSFLLVAGGTARLVQTCGRLL